MQYKVVETKVPSAYYNLTDHKSQLRSYVFDGESRNSNLKYLMGWHLHARHFLLVIRSSLPRLELDEAFASKGEIANAVKNQLSSLMTEYGYEILVALVTDLNPDQTVKNAMNEINGNEFDYLWDQLVDFCNRYNHSLSATSGSSERKGRGRENITSMTSIRLFSLPGISITYITMHCR